MLDRSDIMTNLNKFIESDEEREEGHVDTRERNFECENKDPHSKFLSRGLTCPSSLSSSVSI